MLSTPHGHVVSQFDNEENRKTREADARRELRDKTFRLVDVDSEYRAVPAASEKMPSFQVGGLEAPHPPVSGSLSPEAEGKVMVELTIASISLPEARDEACRRAANHISTDWHKQRGPESAKDKLEDAMGEVKHAVRQQVVFSSIELGKKLGMDPLTSSSVGYSLERALESASFSTLVHRGVDGSASFLSSTSSRALELAGHAGLEANFQKALTWLDSHGLTKDLFKSALDKHSGKLQFALSAIENPSAFEKVAAIMQHAPSAAAAITVIAKDAELRHAFGDIALNSGESLASANKGLGSVLILSGSALRGDSTEETGRHAFRAFMSVAGGVALGSAVGGATLGVGALAAGYAGSVAGGAIADKMLAEYDEFRGNAPVKLDSSVRTVSKDQMAKNYALLEHDGLKEFAKKTGQDAPTLDGQVARVASNEHVRERAHGFASRVPV